MHAIRKSSSEEGHFKGETIFIGMERTAIVFHHHCRYTACQTCTATARPKDLTRFGKTSGTI